MYQHHLAIIAPVSQIDRANAFMEQNGYGPNNLSHAIINKTDADNAAVVAYGNMSPVDNEMRAALVVGLGRNPLIKSKLTSRKLNALELLLDELNYRLKPIEGE